MDARPSPLRRASVPADLALPPAAAKEGQLRVTFLGVSTLLFDDGRSAVLTDGFLSRPGLLRCALGRIAPNVEAIDRYLDRAAITRLDAVIALHSHYDHVMDAPTVAAKTGAVLVGSESTAQVARGAGLERFVAATAGEPMQIGDFSLTLLASAHVPPHRFTGEITEPLVPPVRVSAYRMSTCYALLVQHHERSLLVQASAGHVPNGLDGYRAEVVYLGVGTLGRQPRSYQDEYWRQTVDAVGARRVIPIHWDDFWRPLDRPLRPLPPLIDDFAATIAMLRDKAAAHGVDLRMPIAWQPTDPWVGL